MPGGDSTVPSISTEQMREVDRLMIEEYGITLVQMMENAGRDLAQLARERFLAGDPRGKRVLVLAGTGGNGGGGLVCARRLHNMGADVSVNLSSPPERMADVTRMQLGILERMGVASEVAGPDAVLPSADLAVDALIGYSLKGALSGPTAALVRAANESEAPVLALDVPSGVEGTTGEVHEPAIHAAATMTLALPKLGLEAEAARADVGELYLADIGVPPSLYARLTPAVEVGAIFATDEIIKLR